VEKVIVKWWKSKQCVLYLKQEGKVHFVPGKTDIQANRLYRYIRKAAIFSA
jgi:hypothetical protein